MKFKVLNTQGKETGRELELSDAIFGIEPNDHALYLAVKLYLANQRQGTHKAKHRGEVAGSTKKLHKQKGTGGSRKGSIKNPVFGNGRVHGPQPRDYGFKLNKKVKTLASKSALAHKIKDNNLIVVEDITMPEAKTQAFSGILSNLNLAETKSLFVLGAKSDKNVVLSSRNLTNTSAVSSAEVNVYQILKSNKLVLSETAVKELTERLG